MMAPKLQIIWSVCFEEGGFFRWQKKLSRYMGMQAAMPVVEALYDIAIASSF